MREACLPCRAGFHNECFFAFSEDLEDGKICCCEGEFSLRGFAAVFLAEEIATAQNAMLDAGVKPESGTKAIAGAPLPQLETKKKGDSGYIHPDAWPSTQDIGTFDDPASSGRKRQAKMYPISAGQVCEWAGKKGQPPGHPVAIIGCMNNPASDLHHGPDKNTLDNEKASWGIGTRENTHIICSECHNTVHAAMDAMYPPYDRVADQTKPWLPIYPEGWQDSGLTEASFEELMEEEKRRYDDRKRRKRTTRGRNAHARGDADLTVDDE